MESELVKRLKEQFRTLNVVDSSSVETGVFDEPYIDIRKAYSDPKALGTICECIMEQAGSSPTCVAVNGDGGMPIATGISLRYGLPQVFVREHPKKRGSGNGTDYIDGYFPSSADKVIIVGGLFIPPGQSFKKSVRVVQSSGAKVLGCYTVFKKGEGNLGVPLYNIFTAADFSPSRPALR